VWGVWGVWGVLDLSFHPKSNQLLPINYQLLLDLDLFSGDTLRASIPEILYVSYEHLSPEWIADEFCPILPDLVIEIISPAQTFGQLIAQARDYLDAGVLRVWVVDSQARSITQ
ncbi:Uma2 family endonuclease, partial [Hydrocoleum sp. CS-953]|uniref:Uma2 family endonuclease n=1 Tax=Hydrocoleum sp. CS-953 TaxID=1671698 RepID=UPI00117B786A